MPEPNGAPQGGGNPNPDPQVGNGGNAPAPQGGDGGGNQGASGQDPQETRLSVENAKARLFRKDVAKRLGLKDAKPETILSKLQELLGDGDGTPSDDDDEGGEPVRGKGGRSANEALLQRENANLKAKLGDLEKRFDTKEQKASAKLLRAELSAAVSKAGVIADLTDDAVALLSGRAKVAEDDTVVFTVQDENGDEVEVPVNAEAIRKHKLLKSQFFEADGVAGSGSRGPNAGGAPLNIEKLVQDPNEYAKNRDKIRNQWAAQQGR